MNRSKKALSLLLALSIASPALAVESGGPVSFPTNVTPLPCSVTITAADVAQNLPNLGTTSIHGFTISNVDETSGGSNGENLYYNLTGTAVPNTAGTTPLSSPSSAAGMGSYTTPAGLGSNHAVSVRAHTAGHSITCNYW
jgi:type 1 fimbria pilin